MSKRTYCDGCRKELPPGTGVRVRFSLANVEHVGDVCEGASMQPCAAKYLEVASRLLAAGKFLDKLAENQSGEGSLH